MGWISPELGAGLAIGPRVDLTCEGLTPAWVIDGYAPAHAADILAGHYLGWLHRVRATVGAFSYGAGAGVICSFPLLGTHATDPLAAALLGRICEIAAGSNFAPRTALRPGRRHSDADD
jgi:hypothetical protein